MKLIYKVKTIEDHFKGRDFILSFWLLIRILNPPRVLGKRRKAALLAGEDECGLRNLGRCPSPAAQRCVTLSADSASLRPPLLGLAL